jgi:hypothetical protein
MQVPLTRAAPAREAQNSLRMSRPGRREMQAAGRRKMQEAERLWRRQGAGPAARGRRQLRQVPSPAARRGLQRVHGTGPAARIDASGAEGSRGRGCHGEEGARRPRPPGHKWSSDEGPRRPVGLRSGGVQGSNGGDRRSTGAPEDGGGP